MFEWHGGGVGIMWVFWVLVIALLAWFAVFATRRGGSTNRSDKSALEILEERYALGEIERAEFEQKRKDLIS